MHGKYIIGIGRWLMRLGALRIIIVDDEDAYFNKQMLKSAATLGFSPIERYKRVDQKLYQKLISGKYNIVILDVKGITDPSIAKDGLALAKNLKANTSSYVVITSAHQFHLSNQAVSADYVIEQRTLTSVDFIHELKTIVERYLELNLAIYKKLAFRLGFSLVKPSLA